MQASNKAKNAAIAAWQSSDKSTSGMIAALRAAWRADRSAEPLPDRVLSEALCAWSSGSPDAMQMVLAVWSGLREAPASIEQPTESMAAAQLASASPSSQPPRGGGEPQSEKSMSRPIGICPTTGKLQFETEKQAKRELRRIQVSHRVRGNYGKTPERVYGDCRCGLSSHIRATARWAPRTRTREGRADPSGRRTVRAETPNHRAGDRGALARVVDAMSTARSPRRRTVWGRQHTARPRPPRSVTGTTQRRPEEQARSLRETEADR